MFVSKDNPYNGIRLSPDIVFSGYFVKMSILQSDSRLSDFAWLEKAVGQCLGKNVIFVMPVCALLFDSAS